MTEFVLYGIDEAGRTAFSEVLPERERISLKALARERLRQWHAVEIWEGPMCVVRVMRSPDACGGSDPRGSITGLSR